MKVVIAPDSFKGGPDAAQVAAALARGWRQQRHDDEIVLLPLADGGEGTLDALQAGVPDAQRYTVPAVVGPDGREHPGQYLLLADGTAVVELASVSGLPLIDRLDALGATSRAVGQVIDAALDAGADRILLGLGGSASTDGGTGALSALGARFLASDGSELPDGGGELRRLATVDLSGLREPPPRGMEILTDVDSPLLGERGAAAVFGPQKGADSDAIEVLETGLSILAAQLGGDATHPGSGAAGGVGFGFCTVWGAQMRLGSVAIASQLSVAEHLADADLVITGEGRLDTTSLRGKVVGTVVNLADNVCVEVAIVAGGIEEVEFAPRQVPQIVSLTDLAGSAERSIASPEHYLERAGTVLAHAQTR